MGVPIFNFQKVNRNDRLWLVGVFLFWMQHSFARWHKKQKKPRHELGMLKCCRVDARMKKVGLSETWWYQSPRIWWCIHHIFSYTFLIFQWPFKRAFRHSPLFRQTQRRKSGTNEWSTGVRHFADLTGFCLYVFHMVFSRPNEVQHVSVPVSVPAGSWWCSVIKHGNGNWPMCGFSHLQPPFWIFIGDFPWPHLITFDSGGYVDCSFSEGMIM